MIGNRVAQLVFLAVTAFVSVLCGQGRPDRAFFDHSRVIVPGGAGPNRLEIDIPLLAGANPFRELSHYGTASGAQTATVVRNGLSDLRIYDARGREIPYLLIEPPIAAARWIVAKPVRVEPKTHGGFEADFGRLVEMDCLRISGIAAPFVTRVRVEASGDGTRWKVLAHQQVLFDLPANNQRQLEIEFEPGNYRYLKLSSDQAGMQLPPPQSCSARLVDPVGLPTPMRVLLSYERRSGEPGVSRYQVRLPGAHMPITAIELSCTAGNALRQARLSEGRLDGVEIAPFMLGMASLWHSAAAVASETILRIPVTPPREAILDLKIQDGDKPPLNLTGITAVFAQLPWIYFESPGNGPLTAVFGRPDLPAPQYDVEAARGSVGKQRLLTAHWAEFTTSGTNVQKEAGSPLATGAPIDIRDFRYVRPIPAGRTGLTALRLDAGVLAFTDLSDLRIADVQGRQVPYVLEKLDEPLIVELPMLEKSGAPPSAPRSDAQIPGTRSYYRLPFPYPHLPPCRLMLTTPARVFRRNLRVVAAEQSSGAQGTSGTEVSTAAWSHDDPDTAAPQLVLPLPNLNSADAFLVVDEGDNSPLPINKPTLLLPAYRVRFFRDTGADLKLCYGNDKIASPRYDIALLAPRLIGAPAEEISLAPEQAQYGRGGRDTRQMLLFWCSLAGAVVLLLALIGRLLKRREN